MPHVHLSVTVRVKFGERNPGTTEVTNTNRCFGAWDKIPHGLQYAVLQVESDVDT